MHIRRILAATDLSPDGNRAIGRAALLAQQHQASLHLLHVLPAMSLKMLGHAFVEHPLVTEKQLYEAAKTDLHAAADTCRQRYAGPLQWYVEIGRPHERIADYVRQHRIDLTVLGASTDQHAPRLMIGATVLKVLRTGTQPVLIAGIEPEAPYSRVLVAVDFSGISSIAMEAAAHIASGATLHVLHVTEAMAEGKMHYAGVDAKVIQQYRDASEQEAMRTMTGFLATLRQHAPMRASSIASIVRRGSPARIIRDEAQALQADLIVMGKHSQSRLEQLLVGSVTEKVLHDLDRDLLLVVGN
ncbi:MAG TPA: universal stress protein [Noviherbaspirillum sp.]|nr:universal stress protein [Noviherbaspirillum sp.]